MGVSYSYLDFENFDGQGRQSVTFSTSDIPVFSVDTGEPSGIVRNILLYDFEFKESVFGVSAQYGVFDRIDVGFFVPIIDLKFRGRIVDRFFLDDPNTGELVPQDVQIDEDGGLVFTDLEGAPRYARVEDVDSRAFQDIIGIRHEEDSIGIGDMILRTKAFFGSVGPLDLGGLFNVSLPTGDDDNLFGVGAVRLDPRFLISFGGARLSMHANAGFHADLEEEDRNRIDYSMGFEYGVAPWLSLLFDHIARIRYAGEDVRKFEVVPGVKINPYGDLVFSFNAIVPLNNEGLTTEWTPNGTAEASILF